jgi:hypothetical protein
MTSTQGLKKHEKYREAYRPGDVYWGLGIEEETYVELCGGALTLADFVRIHQNPERYSVDYWKIYKAGYAAAAIDEWIELLPKKKATPVKLPLLLNAHSLSKSDKYGEPSRTHEKEPKPNPLFRGTTLFQDLSGVVPDVFGIDAFDVWWTQDGDTVEFMTLGFYNANDVDVVNELLVAKKRWITGLQHGLEKIGDRCEALRRSVAYPSKNYGLAVFHTNLSNVAIFNNGTYHINITLPSSLDKAGAIADWKLFEMQHMKVARMFQWLEPLLIAQYGSADVFSCIGGAMASKFPAGTQRGCACRYIGIGTYDTRTALRGKILTVPYERVEGRWIERVYERSDCAYKILPALGLDINFNKHWNHGLEFRIFDWFPEGLLPELLKLLIWMCDESLVREEIPVPQTSVAWNCLVGRCVWEGASALLTEAEAREFCDVFGVSCGTLRPLDILGSVKAAWGARWDDGSGVCGARMLRSPRATPATPTVSVVAPHGGAGGKKYWCC